MTSIFTGAELDPVRDCEHGYLRRSCPICAIESDYAELEARYNALREAVAWLLEAQVVVDENIMCPNWRRHVGISDIVRKARAEVERLLEGREV